MKTDKPDMNRVRAFLFGDSAVGMADGGAVTGDDGFFNQWYNQQNQNDNYTDPDSARMSWNQLTRDSQGRNIYGSEGGNPYAFDGWSSPLPDTPDYKGWTRAGADPAQMMNTGTFYPQAGFDPSMAKYDDEYGYLIPTDVATKRAQIYADSGAQEGDKFDIGANFAPAIFAAPWAAGLIGAGAAGAAGAGAAEGGFGLSAVGNVPAGFTTGLSSTTGAFGSALAPFEYSGALAGAGGATGAAASGAGALGVSGGGLSGDLGGLSSSAADSFSAMNAPPGTWDMAKSIYSNPFGKEVINTLSKSALQSLLTPKSDFNSQLAGAMSRNNSTAGLSAPTAQYLYGSTGQARNPAGISQSMNTASSPVGVSTGTGELGDNQTRNSPRGAIKFNTLPKQFA